MEILNPYTAESLSARGGMYGKIHPRGPRDFPKGGDFAPRGPRDCPRVMPRGAKTCPREMSRAEGVYCENGIQKYKKNYVICSLSNIFDVLF